MSTYTDPIRDFRDAMIATGLNPPEHIEPGKLHRFPANGKAWDDAGWCKLFPDLQGGVFGDWRADIKGEWHASRDTPYTEAERAAFRRKVEAAQRARKAEEAERHAKAATTAQALWKASTAAGADHPYLMRKVVQPVATLRELPAEGVAEIIGYPPSARGEALTGRLIIVPVKINGKLSTVELIDEAGRKAFLADGAKQGGFWAAQPLPDGDGADHAICIGEGVATVLSARESAPYAVIAAMDCGNLLYVAQEMRKRYPKADIVILADIGKGEKEAITAAGAVRGAVAVPVFADGEEGTDFNDMAAARGLDHVAEIINAALLRSPEKAEEARSEQSHGEDIPTFRFVPLKELLAKVSGTQYLVKPYLERGTLAMIYGESQTYKSFIAVDLGLCIAHGVPFHGHPTRKGPVFYICGEGHQGLGRRVAAWRIAHGIDPDTDAPFFVSEVPAELMNPENAALVRAAVTVLANEHGQPALIIVDTTSANMGPGDESSNSDVSRLLANISRELRAPFGAAVLLVHHVGWAEKGRTRGAYAFLGNSDSHIQAERCQDPDKRIVTLTCKKTKDAPLWAPVSFEARVVELGIKDSEGADESSLVMHKVDYVAPIPETTTAQQSQAVQILWTLYKAHQQRIDDQDLPGPARVLLADWQDACIAASIFNVRPDTKDQYRAKAKAFYKLRDKARDKGLIAVEGTYVSPLR